MTAYEATYEQTRDPTAVMLRRIVAFVIDVILTTAVIAIAYVSLAQSTEVPGYLHDACSIARTADNVSNCVQLGNTIYTVSGKDVAVVWLSGLAISVLNVVLLQGATGGTVGKHALALRVVDAEGKECGFGRATIRWLLLVVDALFCFLVGLITSLATKGHQRVGDLVAKTWVVSARDVGYPPVDLAPTGRR
jgi:uncharacterized RDD family membrane protein YckC